MHATSNSAPAAAAISVRGLTKTYGSRKVVDNLDIEIPPGAIAGFVGPNGAGKTTTMAMLLGLVRRNGGSGEVLGEPIDEPARYLNRVGALIESPAFYPSLTGRENLRMLATIGGLDESRIDGQIDAVLDEVGLADRDGDRGDDPYRSYSLGMKQRLGISAGLIGDPDLLVLDEPANGLDPEGVREMRSLVGRMADTGRTVLVSSHDLSELEQICNYLVLIDTGRSLFQGPTSELLSETGAARVTVVPEHRADLEQLHDLLVLDGHDVSRRHQDLVVAAPPTTGSTTDSTTEMTTEQLAATVNRTAFDADIVLVELTPDRITLEDRFLSMIGASR